MPASTLDSPLSSPSGLQPAVVAPSARAAVAVNAGFAALLESFVPAPALAAQTSAIPASPSVPTPAAPQVASTFPPTEPAPSASSVGSQALAAMMPDSEGAPAQAPALPAAPSAETAAKPPIVESGAPHVGRAGPTQKRRDRVVSADRVPSPSGGEPRTPPALAASPVVPVPVPNATPTATMSDTIGEPVSRERTLTVPHLRSDSTQDGQAEPVGKPDELPITTMTLETLPYPSHAAEPARASSLPPVMPPVTAPAAATALASPQVSQLASPHVPQNPAIPFGKALIETQIAPAMVRLLQGEGGAQLRLELNPQSLGHLSIAIERSNDGVSKIALTAERPETLALLQQDGAQLSHALDRAGVATVGRSVTFHLAPVAPPAAVFTSNDPNPGNLVGNPSGVFGEPGGHPGGHPGGQSGGHFSGQRSQTITFTYNFGLDDEADLAPISASPPNSQGRSTVDITA